DPGARDALSDAAAVGVPREEEFAHVDLAAARSEVAWLEGATDDVDAATVGMLSTGLGDPGSVARLRFWRRLAGPEGAARGDEGQRGGADAARARRSRTRRRGAAQRGDRRAPVPLDPNRRAPCLRHPAQAPRAHARRGGCGRRPPRAARRPVTPTPNLGSSADSGECLSGLPSTGRNRPRGGRMETYVILRRGGWR